MRIKRFLLAILTLCCLSLHSEEFPVPYGLPPIPWPADNPYTKKKAELGRLLYFDKRLSADSTISCATCHSTRLAFSDNKAVSDGIQGKKGTRNSPTVINAAYQQHLFWDGRALTLEEQCKGPIANTKEMALDDNAHEAHMRCEERIRNIPGYKALFKEAFGHDQITIDDIAKAVATFERTILSGNSPYDRFVKGNDKNALTEEQIKGFAVFKRVGCANCHNGPNFTDGRFLNIGVGMDAENPDLGRYDITKDPKDWGAFKTPTLREIEHTPPYMHDGSLKTLDEVVDYYNKGGIPNKNLHRLMKPLNMSEEDKHALVEFMKALNGEGWQHFSAPTSFPE